ncbi:GCN5-related protein N-acetyltransferase [Beutenbergia cavernae DSM 12333]|uniref:GCN5-related protein N-acetyltransferase n=1 Tax=Beutenbergia cavernae (strain ATCC BAA-8 / DSM 12333 / CCUG 43141 / JCM 11478 / NBRC 16432 / NCIMB 13614 / HKI 0122) TaxID=471853 RepID=C5C4H6_BEUC1|nr:GNAT family protein [Beutenbergia cavernae]ACQ82100.1 GCN5-related protein N-acetyltransferase [Beutenbergia cavernae DSM 12333]
MSPTTDGVVSIRPPVPGDAAILVAGRDAEFHRFLGKGSDEPRPSDVVLVDGRVVGWVDVDPDHPAVGPGEINLGYHLFAAERGHGVATRAVRLVLQRLAEAGETSLVVVLIDPANERSLALARRAGFTADGQRDRQLRLVRPVRA